MFHGLLAGLQLSEAKGRLMRGERSVQRLIPLGRAGLTGYLTPVALGEEDLLQSLMWKHA